MEKNNIWKRVIIFCIIIIVIIVGIAIYRNLNNGECLVRDFNTTINVIENANKMENTNILDDENEFQKNESNEEIDFNSELVQNLFPLTGAYISNDLRYITKIKEINRDNLTNDFILRLAWCKVTKEDWAESYISESDPVSINADVLDKYIKQIFGDILYEKTDFNNKDLIWENSTTRLYDVKYNKEENRYNIDLVGGDGIGESYIDFLYPKAIKYDNKIEITICPIYIKNCGEIQKDDGSYTFTYVVYKHYNYETQTFNNRLTDTMESVYEDTVDGENVTTGYNKKIQALQEKDLEKYIITYKLNKETNQYEFESLKSK